ncbi:PrgH/EprH family type III secretion apparatus protein, partial [Escherichia coli]|uniref:PrgH/EprH family type III secretion apparatus protein n=1 Tax=Escherichia coli TaxID=562 RepID=UPI00390B796E
MENNDKFLSQDLLESYAIRLLSGPLNGCEYEILNGRLLVIIGNDVSLGRSDAFSELPENTIVVPYGELTGSFEIIITTDPDIVVPRFYVSTSKSIIKALINMHSFEIQLSPIG